MLRLTISRCCLRFDRITNNSYIIISLINIYLQQIFLFFENKSKVMYSKYSYIWYRSKNLFLIIKWTLIWLLNKHLIAGENNNLFTQQVFVDKTISPVKLIQILLRLG